MALYARALGGAFDRVTDQMSSFGNSRMYFPVREARAISVTGLLRIGKVGQLREVLRQLHIDVSRQLLQHVEAPAHDVGRRSSAR